METQIETMNEVPKLLTVDDVAASLRVSVSAVRRWIAKDALPPGLQPLRIGVGRGSLRWNPGTVNDFLKGGQALPESEIENE